MSRRALTGFGVLALFGTAGACGSFTEGNPGTSGPDGGGTDAAEASTVVDEDAAADGGIVVPETTCATATFCSDFEGELDLGFELIKTSSDITLEPAQGKPLSNQALRATANPASYSLDEGFYRRVFTNPSARFVRFRFSAQIVSDPLLANMQFATVGWGNESSKDKASEIQIRLENDKILVKHDEDVGSGIEEVSSSSFAYTRSKWFDVDVILSFPPGAPAKLLVNVGGRTLMAKSFMTLSVPFDPDVGVGITGIDGQIQQSIVIDFDDVIVDVQ